MGKFKAISKKAVKKEQESKMKKVKAKNIKAKEKSGKKAVVKQKIIEKTSTIAKHKDLVKAYFVKERVMTEATDAARDFYSLSRYGSIIEGGKVQLSLLEALYLFEKRKLILFDGRNKELSHDSFLRKAKKLEPNFWIRYCVFKDFRTRGYIIKTALKFGADFRVYERGVKPGEDHAKWIIYPVHEASTLTWHEFSAKNRVAHSTKKRLMIGVVDDEGDVTYYEIRWMRP